ncbi:MAG: mechanosensitive ion channel family protein [Flavobacteriaceae bacterium]
MHTTNKILAFIFIFHAGFISFSQAESSKENQTNDSIIESKFHDYYKKLIESEKLRIADSIKKAQLVDELKQLKNTDNLKKEDLENQLKDIEDAEKERLVNKKNKIDSLRSHAKGHPVIGVLKDTLFLLYSKIGASSPKDRALSISNKIKSLYSDDFLKTDSIRSIPLDSSVDIVYKETIIMSISETDAIWYNKDISQLAQEFTTNIKTSIVKAREENSTQKILIRIGLVLLVIIVARILIWLIDKASKYLLLFINKKKDKWIKDLSYKDYTFLSAEQEIQIILFFVKILKWIIYGIFAYITIPIIFSIFPFTRGWADTLFGLIWKPFKGLINAVWDYLPNLFTILVIFFVMKYFIRFIKYIFTEIKAEKLKIYGFYPDWAMPTYNIVRFMLYAFMFILIFPYLPGSDSDVFKGVSVFLGVLFSLGSSSAIANMIAGLVITYMRPYKIGDRIRIADVSGDVVEKTLLVTRVKTPKNEIITIPNSSVLSGNTINYSIEAEETGLIIHTTITIGYDVPWRKMHEVLEEAANRTDKLLKEPKPFILQTSLDDFYVSYQLNAYTKEAQKQAGIYSDLHQNIQDVCREQDVEILSPHYRANRDGSESTIPKS